MHKSQLLITVILVVVLLLPAVQTVAARQDTQFTIQTITVKGLPAYDMKVSPDGRIAAAYVGQTAAALLNIRVMEYVPIASALPIHLIDLTTGNELGQLTGPTDYITDVAFTSDRKQIASYHRNGEIYLWDIATKRQIKRLVSVMGGMAKIAFLPDGKTLIADVELGFIGNFLQWDMETGHITRIWHKPYKSYGEIKSTTPDNMDSGYAAFDVSPDGKQMATVSRSTEIALWDLATLQPTVLKGVPEKKEDKLKAIVSIRQISFSADGKLLVYFDYAAKQTRFLDVAARTEAKALSIGSQYFGLSPRGDALAWVANRKELWLAKVDQPDLATKVLDFPDTLLVGGPTVSFTPDGNQLIVGGFSSKSSSGDNVIYVITLK